MLNITQVTPVSGDVLLPPRQPRAFVSYGWKDGEVAQRLARDLTGVGVITWFAEWEIKAGDSIRQKIDEGLQGCEFFIVVLSKASLQRPWVQTELDAAVELKTKGKLKKIIPVKLDDCDAPTTIGGLLCVDLSNQDYQQGPQRLTESIFDIDLKPPLGAMPEPAKFAQKSEPPA
jgi:hypothetical protein